MQTLNWKDGRCTNPPAGFAITVARSEYSHGWRFCASKNSGFGGIDDCGQATERQAQLAAEAALWRLGVLPLPEWTKHGRHLECHRIADLTYRAEVSLWRDLGRLTWVHVSQGPHAMAACDLHLRGQWEPVAAAKVRAERHLRAEIAAALAAEAAKETAQ